MFRNSRFLYFCHLGTEVRTEIKFFFCFDAIYIRIIFICLSLDKNKHLTLEQVRNARKNKKPKQGAIV